ncbi:MAG: type II toxin-antitoxin system RelE/ParE family toxin [Candidatus Aenigmarchaeota archaeon]|nr:type II toxin-antitoxin system RelE/ParE family toxin [Candidatus Aenigmarchaeota archaeon]
MKVIKSDEFDKQTKKIKDRQLKERILKQLTKIIENPEIGDFLSHEKSVRKIYIPPFRLLYVYRNNKIYLLDFDHRDKIYKKRLKKE